MLSIGYDFRLGKVQKYQLTHFAMLTHTQYNTWQKSATWGGSNSTIERHA